LVVLDLAGTTVADGGLVVAAFKDAVAARGIGPEHAAFADMVKYVERTMGASKLDVFMNLFGGDRALARAANRAFEEAYQRRIDEGLCRGIDGAAETIRQLRSRGFKIALTTGFSPVTRDALLEALGWGGLADLALSPADAGRGRPYPDMILTAVMRLGVSAVGAVAVAGDTAADIRSGRAAGAGFVAGVLTGAHSAKTLETASADAVFPSVAEFGAEIQQRGRGPR
jgi:phosphonatase-like hydrolase